MATPENFGNRIHFESDGCDADSDRHIAGIKLAETPVQLTLWTDEELEREGISLMYVPL